MKAYFLTVDWCKLGSRGIFADSEGHCFRKDGEPHTELEMEEILEPFYSVLSPESLQLTEEQVSEFVSWLPLAEYSNRFGIATRISAVLEGTA